MGIVVEFNPDLALRNWSEHTSGNRKVEECIPERLEVGKVYPFLKSGLRNYWLDGELPLLETKGEGKLSRPMASIIITQATHFKSNGNPYTKGEYRVVEVFSDDDIHFESYARRK